MSISLNNLNILDKRKVSFIPYHFKKIDIEQNFFLNNDEIEKWIEKNLEGRYYIVLDDWKSHTISIAFENAKELTYFLLACPFLRRT